MTRALPAITAAALLATSCSEPNDHGSLLQLQTDQLQDRVDELVALGVPSVIGEFKADGEEIVVAAGVKELGSNRPPPTDGHFRMGSNTKTFVATVILQLVAEEKLSLDDTVDRWLPGVVSGNGNDGKLITIRHLLQHTSGLYDYDSDLAPLLLTREGFLAHRFDRLTPTDLLAVALAHEPLFPAGTNWSYSNTNYILAGEIIEKVTGRPWGAEVRRRILRPLGLRHTFDPGDDPELPRPHGTAYLQVEDGELIDATLFNPSYGGAAGSLITTTNDLARFWQALLQGQLLSPPEMALLQDTVEIVPGVPQVGYGLGIARGEAHCGEVYWTHGGGIPGFFTFNATSADGGWVGVLALAAYMTTPDVVTPSVRLLEDALCDDRGSRHIR